MRIKSLGLTLTLQTAQKLPLPKNNLTMIKELQTRSPRYELYMILTDSSKTRRQLHVDPMHPVQ